MATKKRWNPFASAPSDPYKSEPEPKQYSTLEVVQDHPNLEAVPGQVPLHYESGLEVVPASEVRSGDGKIVECGISREMRFYTGAEGLEMTMTRDSTVVRSSHWRVNGGAWGILRIMGKAGSLSRRREFKDRTGVPLFVMRKTDMKTRVGETADGKVLFTVRREVLLKHEFSVMFLNVWDGQTVRWDIKGAGVRRGVEISCNGARIASVFRPNNGLREMLSEKSNYVVNIGPRLDYTIMAAITVVYDDMRVDEGLAW